MTQKWIEIKGLQRIAKAQADGLEIEHRFEQPHGLWCAWNGRWWDGRYQFRARPPQPKIKKVKSLCWRNSENGALVWLDKVADSWWQRFPAGDIEGEVEE